MLGPRRLPPLPSPAANTFYAVSIVTSVGFGMLESVDYVEAVQKLRPDIVLSLSDVVEHKPGIKRIEKMGDRTYAWLKDLVEGVSHEEDGTPGTAIFAPILPIEQEQQLYYLQALEDEYSEVISGLFLRDPSSVLSIPSRLCQLPRLSTANLRTPHGILEAVSCGIDLFTVPFVGQATDAGIALAFSFPHFPDSGPSKPLPLGIDMWSPSYASEVSPLVEGCRCYTCSSHHRAYVHHLLSAKEMVGWVLLQLHNHHVMDHFFEGIRTSFSENSLEEARRAFSKVYEAELPVKSGQGPRYLGNFAHMRPTALMWRQSERVPVQIRR